MKNRGRGAQLLLTRNPKKDFYPEGASRPRDLSSHPNDGNIPTLSERVSVLNYERCLRVPTRSGPSGVKDHRRFGVKQKGPRRSRDPIANPHRLLALRRRYFLSSAGLSADGGAGACAGGCGVCVLPDMPSLKLRMPSPNPFMISGMRLPPKKIKITASTTSQ